MTNDNKSPIVLASDMPVTDPAEDAFGYAPFARRLAMAIVETKHPEGLVMAVHGAWGSGKSTLLNFVKHDLQSLPAEKRPIIIDFNPWWFDGHQALAQQFLDRFSAHLPAEGTAFKKVRTAIAEYGGAIGTAAATATGHPWMSGLFAPITRLFLPKPKDVPALKQQVADGLTASGKRFLFIVDDIDRLSPDEIRAIFKVVKALANFPNVVYLLAFDRATVANALNTALQMDGEAYLEKIVQAPFLLPAIDQVLLRRKFGNDVDSILAGQPQNVGDAKYWTNIFFEGIDPYIQKPRDIVRIVNTLTVSYPAVAGEVNFADFIALEVLRIFEPALYATIRDNPAFFTGLTSTRSRNQPNAETAFHDAWLSKVSDARRAAIKDLMMRMFPRVKSVWGNMGYSDDHLARWRNERRVCSREIFDIFFQFGMSADVLGKQELNALIEQASDPTRVGAVLLAAAQIRRPNGVSKAKEYIERLRDATDDLSPAAAAGLLTGLFDVADALFPRADDAGDFPTRWRLIGLANDLLKRIDRPARYPLVDKLVRTGQAITLCCSVIDSAMRWSSEPERTVGAPLSEFTEKELKTLATIFVARLRDLADDVLVRTPELDLVLHRWHQWDDPEYVVQRVGRLFASDDLLPVVLEGYLRFGSRQSIDDAVPTRTSRVNPKDFEMFTDVNALEPRVQRLLIGSEITANQREAAEAYLRSMKMIHAGKDPGSPFNFDDE